MSVVKEVILAVNGMNCASCVAHVSKAAQSISGVQSVDVNLARGRAVVKFDPTQASTGTIAAAITDVGYPTHVEPAVPSINVEEQRLERQMHHARKWFRRAVAGFMLWAPVETAHWISGHHTDDSLTWTALGTSTLAIIYVGSSFYASAWAALRRRTTNMDTLISLGASVAYFYSLIYFLGGLAHLWPPPMAENLYFMESSALLALISLGHWMEARARQSAGSAIRQLLNLTPATALRLPPSPLEGEGRGEGGTSIDARLQILSNSNANPHPNPLSLNGNSQDPGLQNLSDSNFNPHPNPHGERGPEQIPVADVRIDDLILVRPGDRVPIDGVVTEGSSSVDESMISGEPLPVTRTPGDIVIGGTINQDGRLVVRATKIGSETALAQIVKLVETAQSSKPPVQKLADQISAIFVPCVLLIALITAAGWYAWGASHGWSQAQTWGAIAKAACSVLLIACPCALGLAVPAALMVGTGRGARRGILIRDIDALQKAEKINTVVLDKTGTITTGKPRISRIVTMNGHTEDQVLTAAATAEQFSAHPLAKAITENARARWLSLPQPQHFTTEAGYGVTAEVDGGTLLVGNAAMLERHSISNQLSRGTDGQTLVFVADSDGMLGHIELSDEVKHDGPAAIAQLHGLKMRTLMLSGDNVAAARHVAGQIGIQDVRADVLPDQKAAVIKELQDVGMRVAMVGDGINDAPALAQADLGIALGSGSDVAKETGDIVLVGPSLLAVSTAIRLSRATMRIIRQNLFFAFMYNVLAIPLAAMGLLNPLIAAAAMAFSDVTVLGNALRLRYVSIDAEDDEKAI